MKKMTSIEEDALLANEFNTGDADRAFREIFEKYLPKLKFKLLILLKGDEQKSEDLSSEALFKVYERLGSFDPNKGALSTWITKIAHNHFIDHFRKSKKDYNLTSIEDFHLNLDGRVDENDDVGKIEFRADVLEADDILSRKELRKFLDNAIEKGLKSDLSKTLVRLRYYDELSYEEIAEETRNPIGTIKAQLFRARNQLREYIEKSKPVLVG